MLSRAVSRRLVAKLIMNDGIANDEAIVLTGSKQAPTITMYS